MSKFHSISEASKILELVDPVSQKPLNYVLKYWEKNFKIIRSIKINNRRYYSAKQIEIIKKIKYLLKNKGMTIKGVKNLLDVNGNKLDDSDINSLKNDYFKNNLKKKSKLILKKIYNLKNNGKKNSS